MCDEQQEPAAELQLDPSPKNQLGKGVFTPEEEAELLAKGYIFAAILPTKKVTAVLVCKRRIADAVTDAQIDALRVLSGSVL